MKKLDKEVFETIAFLIATSPEIYPSNLIQKVKEYHQVEIDNKDIEFVLRTGRDEIDKYKLGGTIAVVKGIKLGTVKYAPLYERLKTLGRVIDMGLLGYTEERATPKGEVVTIEVKNLSASLDALKQITSLMEVVDHLEEEDYEQPVGIMNVSNLM